MQRVIIFDSADKSGKTSIAKELSRLTNIPYFKCSEQFKRFHGEPEGFSRGVKYGETFLVDVLKQTGHSIIMDRSYPSEWVYSKVFNRPTDDAVLREVDEAYAALGTYIIIPFRSSYDGIVDTQGPLGSQLSSKKLNELSRTYRKFARWTKCKTLFLNVDDEDLQREIDEVKGFINFMDYYDLMEKWH